MKRTFKKVASSTVINSSVRKSSLNRIQSKLREVYDALELLDSVTFKEIDGQAMMNDIDIHMRQIDSVINEV